MTDTGLPELPEDYYWRVKYNSVEIRKNLPDTEWSELYPYGDYYFYDDDDRTEQTPERRTREVEKTVAVKGLFGKRHKTKTVSVVEKRYVDRSALVFSQDNDYSGQTRTTRPHYVGDSVYIAPELIRLPLPVTRENLTALCEKALEGWNTEKATKELLGDYPPKTLN